MNTDNRNDAKNEGRGLGLLGLLGAIPLVTLLGIGRLIAQLLQEPARVDEKLVIFVIVVASLALLVWATAVLLGFQLDRTRRSVARLHPDGVVVIGRLKLQAIETLVRASGAEVPRTFANPIMLFTSEGLSFWRGGSRPVHVAAIQRARLGASVPMQRGRSGEQVSTSLDAGVGEMRWGVQRLTPIGLMPISRSAVRRLIATIE